MSLVQNLQKKIFGKKAVTDASKDVKSKGSSDKKLLDRLIKKKEDTKEGLKTNSETSVPSVESIKMEASLSDIDIEEQVFSEDQAVNKFSEGLVGVQDLIAPAAIEVDFSHMKMNEKFFRTLFVLTYPNMLPTNWMSGVINLPHNLAVSTFYYPIDSRLVMQKLKRKISEFQATLNMTIDEGKIPDPGIKIALDDAQKLQELLAKNEEKYFHYALYITIQADSLKELNDITTEVESTLGTLGIVGKPASLEMELGFKSCIPTGMDNLYKTRNMSTDAISATFPFVTSSLTMDAGVLYGLNRHNNSLVVFDRFSMENANTVVFATSGAGKSYMVKLEIYRSMMLGTKVVVIDPEREYEVLCSTVGGSYISFSQTGGDKINPFDLSGVYEKGENELADKRLFLLGLMKLMLGGLNPEEKALMDKAIGLTYQEKGITDDPSTQRNTPPLMEDLYKILKGMAEEEAHGLATRLEMFIRGAAAGVFDRPTSVDLNNSFTVFSLQELSDELRPIAMYMMLDYIWTRIRRDKSKRILVVDEAWYMMQHEDSARFLYWFAKRARKYFLGVTTITQDVEDFLSSKYGKAIVTNSALKFLLKQNTAAIDKIQEVFKLSDGEKSILLNSGIGEGLFFAGQNHVMVQVVSSEHEHKIVSTDPREAAKRKERLESIKASTKDSISSQASKKLQDTGELVGSAGGKVESNTDKEKMIPTFQSVEDLDKGDVIIGNQENEKKKDELPPLPEKKTRVSRRSDDFQSDVVEKTMGSSDFFEKGKIQPNKPEETSLLESGEIDILDSRREKKHSENIGDMTGVSPYVGTIGEIDLTTKNVEESRETEDPVAPTEVSQQKVEVNDMPEIQIPSSPQPIFPPIGVNEDGLVSKKEKTPMIQGEVSLTSTSNDNKGFGVSIDSPPLPPPFLSSQGTNSQNDNSPNDNAPGLKQIDF